MKFLRFVPMPLALATLAACGSPTLPDNYLTDQWGGESLELVASATVVRLTAPCLRADFRGPVILDADGHFTAEGVVTQASAPGAVGLPSRIVGRIAGDVVTLKLNFAVSSEDWSDDATAYELHRGVEPHWPVGGGCIQ